MSMQEATLRRELTARVATLETQLADLTRRFDDLSKAQRLQLEMIEAKPKKNAA